MTYLEAAVAILTNAGTPLRYDEIVRRALETSILSTQGETPDATMRAQISTSIVREGVKSPFVRTSRGKYALREWLAKGLIIDDEPTEYDEVRVSFFPEYEAVRAFLPALVGMRPADITGLRSAIWEKTGTVDENVDWTEPDRWIPERLDEDFRDLALRIWKQSDQKVNPRHMTGHWNLANVYRLILEDADGRIKITERGEKFLSRPDGEIADEIDQKEGLAKILSLVAERGTVSSRQLLQPWMEYAQRVSRIRAETTGRSFLYFRLRNLIARGLIARAGIKYEVSPAGLSHLNATDPHHLGKQKESKLPTLFELVAAQKLAVVRLLHDHLAAMNPYAFEHVIKQLLQEMGYTDVEVTARSGDKGVDVIARIVVGITEVREVVQVKRSRGSIGRPVLDGLRGSLHRFRAVRGTLVTLGGFTKGATEAAFEPGAAPLQLIDGDRLLQLLIDHEIGVKLKPIETIELDLGSLASDTLPELDELGEVTEEDSSGEE